MASHHGFIPCYIKQLPPRLHERAAQVAAEIHPRNAPAVPPPEGVFPPARLLVLNTKYWGPAPRTLTVSFLEDYSQAVKERILSHMNAWDCSVTFQLVRGTCGPNRPATLCVAWLANPQSAARPSTACLFGLSFCGD
jgi:hypothetical protein